MVIDIVAGFFSGLIGSMGLGGGGILIIYLTLIRKMPQIQAQGINLIFFIPIAVLSLILHTKNRLIDWKIAIKYIIYGLVGLLAGSFVMNLINDGLLNKIFSLILIYIGINELFSKKDK